MSEAGASPFLWVRAAGMPVLGTLLGGIAAFTTLSMADRFYAVLGIAAVAALLCAGTLRGTLLRLVRERALRRLVTAATLVDGANALTDHAEGTRVRIRGIARAAGRAPHGWLFRTASRASSVDGAGLFGTALDFWLVAPDGRVYVEIANARLLGPGGLRDGDEVEVTGALARAPARKPDRTHHALSTGVYRDTALRPILRADRAPLVVAPGMPRLHTL